MSDTENPPTDGTAPTADEERALSLELDGITKEYTEDDGSTVVAVDDVSLDVYEGEFIVLVGPSGCGKTTTLRIVAGLEQPTRGRLRIGGEDVAGQEPRERDIAMVFQNYALYPHKTVRGNIAFPLNIRKYPDDEVERRVRETAELLGIGDLLDRRPADLSGGQQQRVALGRAIVRDPAVFLFDEPLSNLDAKLRIQMRTELNKLHDRVGRTSVYVTHDQVEAMTLSDRVVVMNDGTVQQVAPPKTVYERPTNRFVAGFIGEPPMNFMPTDIVAADGGYEARADQFGIELPDNLVAAVDDWGGDPAALTLGIRPEDINDAQVAGDTTTSANTIEAYVRLIEPMGSDKYLTVSPTAEGRHEFTARVSPDSEIREDEFAELSITRSKMHLFDDETGHNISV